MVLVEYVRTGKRKHMKPVFADALIKMGVVVPVQEAVSAVQTTQTYITRQEQPEPEEEVSPRTGKPKRKYERRDMKAED